MISYLEEKYSVFKFTEGITIAFILVLHEKVIKHNYSINVARGAGDLI